VYVFNDVVESDEDINPKSVICSEPLITPLPNPVRYEDVAALSPSTSVCIEEVNVFNDVVESEEEINQ
jgi:hypothetical protein